MRMNRLFLRIRFSLATLCVSCGMSAVTLSAFAFLQASSLTIVKQAGTLETGAGALRCELGTVDAVETPQLERTFVLRNSSKEPVVIERVQSSCGCTSALIGPANTSGKSEAQTVQPGAEIPIKVALSVTHLNPGFTNKFVWVYVKGEVRPAVTIELTADIKACVSFSPRVLEFGRLQAGTSHSVTLTATIDNRLLKGLPEPQLACSNPDIIVTARPVSVQNLTVDGRAVSLFTYVVGISPKSRLGVLTGSVSFFLTLPQAPNARPGRAPVETPQTVAAVLITAPTVPLSGEVVGKISAAPGSVVFGNIRAGAPIIREITLSASDADALKGLRVVSDSPKVTAELKPSEPAAGQKQVMTLVVRMNADGVSIGAFQSRVTVETSDGQRLVLPVFAYVGAL